MNKYTVTIAVVGNIVPVDFPFVSAELTVWASNRDEAYAYASTFLQPHGIGVYADITDINIAKENKS